MSAIDFNTLPDAVFELLTLTREVKGMLVLQQTNKKETKQFINALGALDFITMQGIPMSKSRLYKLTAQKLIPFRKVGERLIFNLVELQEWCNNQMADPHSNHDITVVSIIKSAQRKNNSFK